MSQSASSMPAIALWVTPPRFWRVARSMSQYRRSTGRGSWPMSSGVRSRTEPAMPCGLRLSLHSPQPTSPSSVSTRTKVQGRQPPSQWSASTRAIFMARDDATAGGPGQDPSRPGRGPAPELLEGEQPDARIGRRGGPRGLRVVAPRGQEERDVVEVRMSRDVLERLQAVLDEGQARPPTVRRDPRRDEPAQVQALVHAGLLALHVREPHLPAVEDQPRELALLGGDEHRLGRLRDEPTQLLDRAVWRVEPEPAGQIGRDPRAADPVQGLAQPLDQRGTRQRPPFDNLVPDALPAAQDLRGRPALRDRVEQHRHLPPAEDHRAQGREGLEV